MLQHLIGYIEFWGYPAIFVGGFIEGLNVTLVSSFLFTQGYFSIPGIFLASASGNYLSDILWYKLGRKYGEYAMQKIHKYIWFFHITKGRENMEQLRRLLTKHGGPTILFTKFMIGPGIATQIAAGATRMPFRQYLRFSLFANIIFTAVLMAIGYAFGQSYLAVARFIRNTGLLLFALVFLVVLLEGYGIKMSRVFLGRMKGNSQ